MRQARQRNPWPRQREGAVLSNAFPGARGVAFVPVWDPRKDRWFAGGFIFTHDPARTFSLEGELSYLRAFGMIAMSEILRFDDKQTEKAKSDILGSISHELRSPLHGVMLTTPSSISACRINPLEESAPAQDGRT